MYDRRPPLAGEVADRGTITRQLHRQGSRSPPRRETPGQHRERSNVHFHPGFPQSVDQPALRSEHDDRTEALAVEPFD